LYGGIFVDMEKEVDKIYGETPSKRINRLKNIIGTNVEIRENTGYLVCHDCGGYYKLKDDEYPEDFSSCECGGYLQYHENNDFQKETASPDNRISEEFDADYYNEYEELEEIVSVIQTKANERKKFLENLSTNIEEQEKLLKTINFEKNRNFEETSDWPLWSFIEENGLKNEISDQKMLIDEIMDQENKFLSKIKEKRGIEASVSKNTFNNFYVKISVLAAIIILLGLLVIYLIK